MLTGTCFGRGGLLALGRTPQGLVSLRDDLCRQRCSSSSLVCQQRRDAKRSKWSSLFDRTETGWDSALQKSGRRPAEPRVFQPWLVIKSSPRFRLIPFLRTFESENLQMSPRVIIKAVCRGARTSHIGYGVSRAAILLSESYLRSKHSIKNWSRAAFYTQNEPFVSLGSCCC